MKFQKNEFVFAKVMGTYEKVKVKKIFKKKLVVEDQYFNDLHILQSEIIRNKTFKIIAKDFVLKYSNFNKKNEFLNDFVSSTFNFLFHVILLSSFLISLSTLNFLWAFGISLCTFFAGIIYFSSEISYEAEDKVVNYLTKKWNN